MADALVTIGADLAQLRRELATIAPEGGKAAAKVLNDLSAAVARAEKEAAKAGAAYKAMSAGVAKGTPAIAASGAASLLAGARAKQYSVGLQSVALQMPDVASQLAAGTNATTVFVQQGLQVVQMNLALVGAGLKALSGLLMGPFGVALAAAVAVTSIAANKWQELRLESQALREALAGTYQAVRPEVVRQAAEDWSRLAKIMAEVADTATIELAGLTDLDRQQIKVAESIRAAAKARLLEVSTRWAALEVQRQEIQAGIDSGVMSVPELGRAHARIKALNAELPLAHARIDVLKEEIVQQVEAAQASNDAVAAHRAAEKAADDAADAAARQAKEVADAAEGETRRIAEAAAKLLKDRAVAEAQLQAIVLDAARAQIGAVDAILARRDEEIAQIAALELEVGTLAGAEQARAAVAGQAEVELAEWRAKLHAELLEQYKRETAAHAASVRARRDATLSASSDLMTSLTDVTDVVLTAHGDEELGPILKAAFALQKAAAVANVGIKIAEGLAVAAALPPPADIIKAAAVGITGAASLATIAATTIQGAPTGGMVMASGLLADHVPLQAQPGEAVLSRAGVAAEGGPAGVQARNAGVAAASGGGLAVWRMDHRVLAASIRDLARSGDLARRLTRHVDVGHR